MVTVNAFAFQTNYSIKLRWLNIAFSLMRPACFYFPVTVQLVKLHFKTVLMKP
jgi:hypothetical protein